MRIAIVNDSLIAVESLRRVIASAPEHEIAWIAHDGAEAVAQCAADTPDLILMDLIMPVMDGVQATRRIMAASPCAILVITATVTGNGAKVFEAMGAGALDALNTPILGASGEGEGKADLLRKIAYIGRLIAGNSKFKSSAPAAPPQPSRNKGRLVAIGASTGGPAALARILSNLDPGFPAAVVVVQHMDSQFMASFGDWLASQSRLPVRLAVAGDVPRSGQVLVAGTKDHLVLQGDGTLAYTCDPCDYPYRPSVNVFFESVAQHWGGEVAGVLLTGMGRDGAAGLQALRKRGFHTIAQDQDTSAVYGMPKAAVELGAAAEVLALDRIATALTNVFDDKAVKNA